MKIIRQLAARLPIPNACRDLGVLAAEFHTHCHRAFELRAKTIVKLFEQCDAFRRPQRFERFLLTCEADARGRTGFEERDYPQADFLRGALAAALAVETKDLGDGDLKGADIAVELRRRRVSAVRNFKSARGGPG
jgi:tRNA nucleotidyltransferase (CCA-adding enzyme)